MTLDIGDVVARAGVPPSTLRFYEEKGLITATGRRGLRRQYDESVLQTLSLIALGRTVGFSLDDIAGMLLPQGKANIDRERLQAKAEDIDKTIRQLSALRDSLRHAAVCPATEHLACPQFQRLMRLASMKGVKGVKGMKEGIGASASSVEKRSPRPGKPAKLR
ncbi:helix-turn-helix domain-containing protein [Pandoraea sputorum]|uniref:helix-turn-helix domain-containing protein n=1 Tax=Pandoraea sputorum TaxID=93222 RepID=UPI001E3FD522|nr:helix-turn-helix domain-containing protein [Pandoraea sputorum]MCE4059699.1 helix-turn-helix domain-containing protein [Pandoraea sputorum]